MMRFNGLVLYVYLGGFVWGIVGAGNLHHNWAKFSIELGLTTPQVILFWVLNFVHVGLNLGG
jgi:hypothetical protein